MFLPLFVVTLGLCYSSEENIQSFQGVPHLSGPSEVIVSKVLEMECEPPIFMNESILLKLFKKGDPDEWLSETTSLDGEPVSFLMISKPEHEGNLECVASVQNISKIEPTVSNTHYLKVIVPVKGAKIDVRSGPVEFFAGQKLELLCGLSAGNHVSYQWMLNGQLISQSPDNRLLISRTTSSDSGSYKCVATNRYNYTIFNDTSPEVIITVKDVVSDPDISFTVSKEDSHNYSATVTCLSKKGTPPVNFSLYNEDLLVANIISDDRSAIFKVPLVLNQYMGIFQCQAENGDKIAYSQQMHLKVVPVGGPVTISYDYDVGENFAVVGLRLYCKAGNGSQPQYQWFLNKTLLHDRGGFYYVVHQPPERSVLLLSVGRSSAGTYHCEVSDSFDNTTAINSNGLYMDKKVLNHVPTIVVAVVFGCFTYLILLVTGCCAFGVVHRRRQFGEKPLSGLEMEAMISAYEGELDKTEYSEDADVWKAAREDEYDQASEASVDEWPQIAEWKSTLEDESIEL